MKSILIISYSNLNRDPRILRQIHALKDDYAIQAVGFTNPNISGVDFFEVNLQICKTNAEKIKRSIALLIRQFRGDLERRLSFDTLLAYDYKEPDAIFANDWDGLYAATRLKKERNWSSRIYFDAHEYFPEENNSLSWRVFTRPLIRHVLSQAKSQLSIISTVCPSLARMYEDYLGLAHGTVRVITNAPSYEPELHSQPIGGVIRLVHHGVAMRERQLEKMIDMMTYLPIDRYELNLILMHDKNDRYYRSLVKRASRHPNIRFLEPVPTDKIASFINQFDIGIVVANNSITSYKYSLPNKFFEFVQARLAIAVGDSPEMRSYIERYQLGVSSRKNTPRAMAEEILKLSKDEIMSFKRNADSHARELSAEPNIEAIRQIASELTGA